MKNEKITCEQFWNLPKVIEAQNIQKQNPYGSKEHREADETMLAICAEYMGKEFALDYFGEY